jgi:hypothetical protein
VQIVSSQIPKIVSSSIGTTRVDLRGPLFWGGRGLGAWAFEVGNNLKCSYPRYRVWVRSWKGASRIFCIFSCWEMQGGRPFELKMTKHDAHHKCRTRPTPFPTPTNTFRQQSSVRLPVPLTLTLSPPTYPQEHAQVWHPMALSVVELLWTSYNLLLVFVVAVELPSLQWDSNATAEKAPK